MIGGKVVTNRGEKTIRVPTARERELEEYDGGSRGKVFTKGKRGVG